jgi:hypothetical protein
MSSLLVFSRVYRLEIQLVSHVGSFDPSCELLPLYLLSDLIHPSPPSQSKHTVCGCGREWGVMSCVVDHILQKFNTLFLTRFRIYDIWGLLSLYFLRPWWPYSIRAKLECW